MRSIEKFRYDIFKVCVAFIFFKLYIVFKNHDNWIVDDYKTKFF